MVWLWSNYKKSKYGQLAGLKFIVLKYSNKTVTIPLKYFNRTVTEKIPQTQSKLITLQDFQLE